MPYIQLSSSVDLLALHQYDVSMFPCLLQSSGDTGWDILFALPQQSRLFYAPQAADFFAALAALPIQQQGEAAYPLPFPFHGGWFIYAAYELLHQIEPTVLARTLSEETLLAALIRIPAAVLYHRDTGTTWLVAEDDEQLRYLEHSIQPRAVLSQPVHIVALQEDAAEVFLQGVARCKQYIAAGDVFQVNLSRAWEATLAQSNHAIDVYAQLRQVNPAPFSACVDLGVLQIISASPERLVRVKQRSIETRPIAGTRPRAETAAADEALKAQLLASAKERAEHIMLIDLERNDLGRVCQSGTVEVNEMMQLASYAYVHHLESNVRGRLRCGITIDQILRALFPGGTITGCPKVRTMQIIRELETQPRLAYTGSLGYINQDGSLDLNILIRSFVKQGTHLGFRAGAGIVADSVAERELHETRAKAKGLLRALGLSAEEA